MSVTVDRENDLPVLANTSQILIEHFSIDLQCSLEKKQFQGNITLFLDPACSSGENKQIFSIQDVNRTERLKKQPSSAAQNVLSHGHGSFDNTPTDSNKQTDGPKAKASSCVDDCGKEDFHLILDCCDLLVDDVEEVLLPEDLYSQIQSQFSKCDGSPEKGRDLFLQCRTCSGRTLMHSVEKWCLKVWKQGVKEAVQFSRVVRIFYRTLPTGQSLRWTKDQNASPCVYTAAMWVNNRAFMPCQEYGSLSTWQAAITVPESHVVLMSSDFVEMRLTQSEPETQAGCVTFYHQCSSPLPSYTLALAVGHWESTTLSALNPSQLSQTLLGSGSIQEGVPGFLQSTCRHVRPCQINYSKHDVLPSRVFAPAALLDRAAAEFSDYYRKCCKAVQEILGPSPFQRVDFVIYPSCSQDMAMANGGLVFLSQSLLAGDGSMSIRLSHELTHFWFGLLIGAKDWTEEWLSEGFATFMEDSVHALAMGWSEERLRDYSELRALLRYQVLEAELGQTEDDLQVLRPQRGCELHDVETSVMYVKNGMNPKKLFTQVHYLKGYFLLRYLAAQVGVAEFNKLIKDYVIKYHGCLVYSQDFLSLVLETFPSLVENGLTLEKLFEEWFDCPGMPKHVRDFTPSPDNVMYKEVLDELVKWKKVEQTSTRPGRHRKKKLKMDVTDQLFTKLEANQLVLLLEEILLWKKVSAATLHHLNATYNLSSANADVRHRWNELVVKHKYTKAYDDVRKFLIDDQAMGVYLYGEMMISGSPTLRGIAQQVFQAVGPEMESGTYHIVHSMLFGTASQEQTTS